MVPSYISDLIPPTIANVSRYELIIVKIYQEFQLEHLHLVNLAFHLPSMNRVGRQGTLLCKEINIGYL